MRQLRRYWVFLAIVVVLFLTGCSGYSGYSAGPDDYYYSQNVSGWDAYKERCQRLNQSFEPANVIYNPTEGMRRENSKIIEAAVTLRTELPPQEILKTKEAVAEELLVSCVIEAELRADEAEFGIQPQGWKSQSLLTSETARWTWFVTPKRGGKHELVLAFRPVIAVADKSETSRELLGVEASTQPYRIMVDVSVPGDQWVADKFDRATALLKSAEGMVTAFAALAVAIIALLAVKWRRGKSAPN